MVFLYVPGFTRCQKPGFCVNIWKEYPGFFGETGFFSLSPIIIISKLMSQNSGLLPSQCLLRPASAQDMGSIRMLVWSAKLDPTQLRWQQFWVIECDGNLAACGQLRNFAGRARIGQFGGDERLARSRFRKLPRQTFNCTGYTTAIFRMFGFPTRIILHSLWICTSFMARVAAVA
jgi:hypothetical protein